MDGPNAPEKLDAKRDEVKHEWLVSDRRGAFAMGTARGIRDRKYHGFFQGIAGRSETSFLAELDLACDGHPLWPHRYSSPGGSVVHPHLHVPMRFDASGPRWEWELPNGKLTFAIEANEPAGIRLIWRWRASGGAKRACLEIRPFFAMRNLHGLGGQDWSWEPLPGGLARVAGASHGEAFCLLRPEKKWQWTDSPLWFHNFHYSEEKARGYPFDEDLFAAGLLAIELEDAISAEWVIAEDVESLGSSSLRPSKPRKTSKQADQEREPALDFVLREPAGIVAGFPWFGEWGRDTFIALPGIAAAMLESSPGQGGAEEAKDWTFQVLERWGDWIRVRGMLPNLIATEGELQWESSDATLWWCHAAASLWAFSLDGGFAIPGSEIESRCGDSLERAIETIRSGRHAYLRETSEGLLDVTGPHSTWMDARVHGVPVTPRIGRLPEINALWFQARCLHSLWSGGKDSAESRAELERLGKLALTCREPDRPNSVFLHSIPLAPSFVLNERESLAETLADLSESFRTPVGLRTLRPGSPGYRPRCVGSQEERDLAYHQGPVWAWLGGHYEMAKDRLPQTVKKTANLSERSARAQVEFPIQGHVPEIFDAEEPFTPRGAPAQAWSIACLREARTRRRLGTDLKLSELLARRWTDRETRTRNAVSKAGRTTGQAARKSGSHLEKR